MNRGYAWTVDGKVRKWTLWLLAVAVASQFYFVQELLAAFAFFAIGFAALAFAVLSLYLLQSGCGLAVVRIFDGGRWMERGTPAMLWPAWQDVTPVKVGAGVENGKQELERLEQQGQSRLGGRRKVRRKNLRALGSESGRSKESGN